MSVWSRPSKRIVLCAAAVGLTLGVAGCESMDALNPFVEKEKKLTGSRVPVFPEGVPGVDYNAPPQQPANAGDYGAAPTPESPAAQAATGSTRNKSTQ